MLQEQDQEAEVVAPSAGADDLYLAETVVGRPDAPSPRGVRGDQSPASTLPNSPRTSGSAADIEATVVVAEADADDSPGSSQTRSGGGNETSYDETRAVLGLRGPVASLWSLFRRSCDWLGVTWHRRELNSQSYRMMRHGLYSTLLTMAMLLGILTHCFLWEVGPATSPADLQAATSACGTVLKLWLVINTGGFLYEGCYNQWDNLSLGVERGNQAYGSLDFLPSVWYTVLRHVVAISIVIVGLSIGLRIVGHFGLDRIKSVVLIVLFFNALASIRCCRQYTMRILRLELSARHAERRAFRNRLVSHVLSIAMFLEVPSAPSVEEQVDAVLDDQLVLSYDSASFQDHPECCICSREFDAEGGEICSTRCHHVFHTACLGGWLHRSSSCPLCREDLAAGVHTLPHHLSSMIEANSVQLPRGLRVPTLELEGHHRQRGELAEVIGAMGDQRNSLV
eukprot:TRINITY_DN55665_c0_g1_i1.p1 TRINITY_DN55665_c0_g1~~TRINITY_DN55665_c0_g1_i1.p1  ORF type:complete len:453 (-),score=56.80 TRINITY_DN55665_c0_g1_i1:9-1367(-)